MTYFRRFGLLALCAVLGINVGFSVSAKAQAALPSPRALSTVEVDAREAPRGILKVHLRLPVSSGPLTLVYPKWLPGRHGPAGPITNLAGPVFHVRSTTVNWQRDPLDMYAFHLTVPPNEDVLDCEFEVITALRPDGAVNGLEAPRTATEALAILEWHQFVLYPENSNTDQLNFQASVHLPTGWHYASALRTDATLTDGARFMPTSLTTLVDSTLIAGRYMADWDLAANPPVKLHVVADSPTALQLSPQDVDHYRRLVREASALFGATHYQHYDFLYTLTDQIMPDGLEHHQSSDNRSPYRTFLDEDVRLAEGNLLAHEYSHSWNGKYRRPQGLATRNYQDPMQSELLWVYEGLTEYLGDVLATRSGIWTPEQFNEEMARNAANQESHHARTWRNLADTTTAAQLIYVQPRDWASRLRRQEDFYQESALLWLEADVLIRKLSAGKRSLDTFCQLFHGGVSSDPSVVPYTFDDVVNALNQVQPYDWRGFWTERLQRHRDSAPTEGFTAAGWQFVLNDTPSTMHRAHETDDRDLDWRFSLGMYIGDEGAVIADVVPGSPADAAGLTPGDRVIAVNGRKWSREGGRDALRDNAKADPATRAAIRFLVEKDDFFKTVDVHYASGERYPHLQRLASRADLLADIVRPRVVTP